MDLILWSSDFVTTPSMNSPGLALDSRGGRRDGGLVYFHYGDT